MAALIGRAPAAALCGDPTFVVDGASSEERARVDDAIARFRAAGLRLPNFRIVFIEDEAACEGHLGSFRRVDQAPRISVCSGLEFVVLHELAHVWVDANIDEAERRHYLQFRDLETWFDTAVPWMERGIEDAAFVMQQNLRDVAPNVLRSATWTERIEAYELLTGRGSPLRTRIAD